MRCLCKVFGLVLLGLRLRLILFGGGGMVWYSRCLRMYLLCSVGEVFVGCVFIVRNVLRVSNLVCLFFGENFMGIKFMSEVLGVLML